MKCLLVLCTLLLSMSVQARDSKLTSLSAFQWLNRIVVVNRIEQTQQYAVKPGEVILIGKDGGLKLRLDNLDIPILFSVIDAMPMRQNEMQRQWNEYDF